MKALESQLFKELEWLGLGEGWGVSLRALRKGGQKD